MHLLQIERLGCLLNDNNDRDNLMNRDRSSEQVVGTPSCCQTRKTVASHVPSARHIHWKTSVYLQQLNLERECVVTSSKWYTWGDGICFFSAQNDWLCLACW